MRSARWPVVGLVAMSMVLSGTSVGLGASPSPVTPGQAGDPSVLTSSGVTVRALAADDAAAAADMASPEPEAPRWPLFADAEKEVASGMLEVDDQDGIHVAYAHYVPLAEKPKAAYAYCPATAACGSGEGWIGVEFGEDVLGVMLATTSDGHPRVLIQQDGRCTRVARTTTTRPATRIAAPPTAGASAT